MKKIWPYISALLFGFAAGIITMYKIMGDQISIEIKKIKTKRGSSEVVIPINVESAQKKPRRTKDERKQDNVIKRNLKKRDKDLKRLNDG